MRDAVDIDTKYAYVASIKGPKEVYVREGSPVTFTCEIVSQTGAHDIFFPKPRVRWLYEGKEITHEVSSPSCRLAAFWSTGVHYCVYVVCDRWRRNTDFIVMNLLPNIAYPIHILGFYVFSLSTIRLLSFHRVESILLMFRTIKYYLLWFYYLLFILYSFWCILLMFLLHAWSARNSSKILKVYMHEMEQIVGQRFDATTNKWLLADQNKDVDPQLLPTYVLPSSAKTAFFAQLLSL